jgi:outer membrane protein OmpA-like peptidoglycan-associated protein
MNKIKLIQKIGILLPIVLANPVAMAKTDQQLTYFCAQENVNQQHVVEVGDIKTVHLHHGPFQLIEVPSDLEIAKGFLRKELSRINLPSGCKEYLLSQAGFSTYDQGDLIARVYFSFDQSSLTQESRHILQQLEEDLSNSESVLLVEGHTDSTGTQDYNMVLGLNRAKSVEQQMIELGAGPELLILSSKGESSPIADNSTVNGRSQNRRVDVTLAE